MFASVPDQKLSVKWPGLRNIAVALLALGKDVFLSKEPESLARRMALMAFVIRLISAAIAFVSQIILARFMGEFEYGIFVFTWVFVVIFGNLSCFGFHTTIIRFLPHYDAENRHDAVRGLTITARLIGMIIATGVGGLGLLCLHVFQHRFDDYYAAPLFIACFCLPLIALGDILEGTARANSWAINALSPTYIIRPLLILFFMIGLVFAGYAATAVHALIAALAATYVTTLGQYLVITWRMRRAFATGPRAYHLADWTRVAFPVFIIEGIGFLLTNSDVILVGLFLPPQQVAIYFAAAKTIVLMQFVYFSVKAAAGPRFSSLMAEGDPQQLAAFAGRTVRWVFWPSLIVGLVVLFAGHFLLSLFGSAFDNGYWVMVILFAGILAKSMVGPGESLLTMAGEQSLCMKIYVAVVIANIGLSLFLIPTFGIQGAAVATMLATMFEAVVLHLVVKHRLNIVLFVFANPLSRFNGLSAELKG
jgi:O-antigen/teichoic acid export membrane protein